MLHFFGNLKLPGLLQRFSSIPVNVFKPKYRTGNSVTEYFFNWGLAFWYLRSHSNSVCSPFHSLSFCLDEEALHAAHTHTRPHVHSLTLPALPPKSPQERPSLTGASSLHLFALFSGSLLVLQVLVLRVLAPCQVLVPLGLRGWWAQPLQGLGGEPGPGRTPGCQQQGDGEDASPGL